MYVFYLIYVKCLVSSKIYLTINILILIFIFMLKNFGYYLILGDIEGFQK